MFGFDQILGSYSSRTPAKSIIMDAVVVDIPPKFGMLLSGSWDSKLKGTLQMDMSYAKIPLFGENRKLYIDKILAYVVSSQERLDNHPIYVVDTDLEYSIFYNDFHIEEDLPIVDEKKEDKYFSKRQESLENKKREEGV